MVAAENENAVSNLLLAYENEVNAHARYQAFASRAEAEGMNGAASLFRAAARAEQIHASNHARVIRHIGRRNRRRDPAISGEVDDGEPEGRPGWRAARD